MEGEAGEKRCAGFVSAAEAASQVSDTKPREALRGEVTARNPNKAARARQSLRLGPVWGQPSAPGVGAGAGWQPTEPGEQEGREGFLRLPSNAR